MNKWKMVALFSVFALCSTSISPSWAAPLQGGVQEEDFRITPPDSDKKTNELRIARAPVTAPEDALKGLVDTEDFNAQNFDLGAEKNSKELVLAWERWHHQLTKAIYTRWRAVNHMPGTALMRITVTRDLHITAEVLKSRCKEKYSATILDVIASLDTNPGLTFPAKSQRQVVTFDCNMTAGHVSAGYTWDKRDYETVRDDN